MEKPRTRRIAIIGATFALLCLIVSGVVLSNRERVTVDSVRGKGSVPGNPYYGSIVVTVNSVDHISEEATVTLKMIAESAQPMDDLPPGDLYFSVADNERGWSWNTERLHIERTPIAKDKYFFKIVMTETKTVPIRSKGSEHWFPFDNWDVTINPSACFVVSTKNCKAADALRIGFTDVSVLLGDSIRSERTVITDANDKNLEYHVAVGRTPLLKLLPIVFLVIASFYVYYVFRLQSRRELVGKSLALFAGLWGFRGILVPQEVKIFPTTIDYGILFFGAAAFILSKADGGNDDPQSDSSDPIDGTGGTRAEAGVSRPVASPETSGVEVQGS